MNLICPVFGLELMFFFFGFQVAEEIWVCENSTVTKWKGNILDYKDHLKSKIQKEGEKREGGKKK